MPDNRTLPVSKSTQERANTVLEFETAMSMDDLINLALDSFSIVSYNLDKYDERVQLRFSEARQGTRYVELSK